MDAIDVRHLDVDRGGNPVLRDVSFTAPAGRLTGLLGPSGCGKTTLMRSVVGVQRIAGGEVRVLGEPAGTAGLRERVGYVTQAPSVYADLSVRENLRYFAAVLGAGRDEVERVLADVDLARFGDRPARSLSGGQRARVSLATALIGSPELLVLDEPTVGLDPLLRVSLWRMFRKLAAGGTAILISSHVMDEAEHCDSLTLMRDGRVIASESPASLRSRTGRDDLEEAFVALIEADAA
jgi:ABC-2 type transport system ATP-binding protein